MYRFLYFNVKIVSGFNTPGNREFIIGTFKDQNNQIEFTEWFVDKSLFEIGTNV